MKRAYMTINRELNIGKVDERLFGSFVEHLGRAVYDGLYQPGNVLSDEDGFRMDVIEAVRELSVPIIRYPGGNFVSNFFWEDSVGPKSNRPRRLELAWRSIETNQVGVQEFYNWTQKVDAKLMMAVNLGTRGVVDACNFLEYCNFPGGTKYSDMRIQHGKNEPYDIKLWCLGNEMDGPWQLGQKTMEDYGKIAREAAKSMKLIDPTIEIVACGSSGPQMDTFPQWEETVLDIAYEYIDYVSLHNYYGNRTEDTLDYLASTNEMDEFISTVINVCDIVKKKHKGTKDINLSFDEWNVWFHSNEEDDDTQKNHPWQIAPKLLEDQYNFEDALVVGLLIITLLKHADRVKIACLAQLINVIAPIMTEQGGGRMWKQTIFYPFSQASRYGRGTVITPLIEVSKHDTASYRDVTDLETVSVYNEECEEITIFAVNRTLNEEIMLTTDFSGFRKVALIEHSVMECDNLKAVNSPDTEMVIPRACKNSKIVKGKLESNISKASWNMIRLKLVK